MPAPARARVPRRVVQIAWIALALTLAVRLAWVFYVQSPFDTIYSDMGGYVDRARELVDGVPRVYPRLRCFYPYGTHYVFALLFKICGEHRQTLVRVVYAAMASFPAYHFILLASRLFPRPWALALLGVLFAFWQPTVWFVGYFISEVPFSCLLFYNAWLAVRFAEEQKGGLRLGLTSAVLFAVRPQFILTFGLFGLLYLLTQGRRVFRLRSVGAYARVLVPWACVLIFSAARLHAITGHWGLISENSGLNRVMADTTYSRFDAYWPIENGGTYYFWVAAPAKNAVDEHDGLRFDGYIGDNDILDAARKKWLEDKTVGWRVRHALRNVQLLYLWNDPWPEEDAKTPRLRHLLQIGFNQAVRYLVLPLAVLGVFAVRRRAALAVVLAHIGTAVGLAMLYFPEARYRCPYDPMLLLLALAGTGALWELRPGGKVWRFLVGSQP